LAPRISQLPFKNRNQQPEIRNCSYFLLFLLTSYFSLASGIHQRAEIRRDVEKEGKIKNGGNGGRCHN